MAFEAGSVPLVRRELSSANSRDGHGAAGGVDAPDLRVVPGWALLAVGPFNSTMFPTISSLASEGLGRRGAEGSGVTRLAVVEGAIVSPLTGHVADLSGLAFALIVPALCYAVIGGYGVYARRPTTVPPL